jgi:hypothetical protein
MRVPKVMRSYLPLGRTVYVGTESWIEADLGMQAARSCSLDMCWDSGDWLQHSRAENRTADGVRDHPCLDNSRCECRVSSSL